MAILAVLLGHFGTSSGLNAGRLGVELFFVLSGRLMAEILFVRRTPLRQFFPRRVSRVWPALFFMALVSVIAGQVGIGDAGALNFIAAITFTTNYAAAVGIRSGWLDHTWSLCVEEHIYIILGILAFLLKEKSYRFTTIVLLVLSGLAALNGLFQTIILNRDYFEVYWRSDVRGASILVGAAMFLALRRADREYLRNPLAPVIFGMIGVILQVNVIPDPLKYTAGTACLAVAVALLPQLDRRLDRLLTTPKLLYIGMISYSLYLWQQPFYKAIEPRPVIWQALGERAGLLLGALCFAYLSYRYIEGPARKFLNRMWGI